MGGGGECNFLQTHVNIGSVWSTVGGSCDRLSRHIVGVSLHNDSLNDLLLVLIEDLREVLV